MTILGAMDCGSYLAVGADSLAYQIETSLKFPVEKLWAVPDMQIVYGLSGGRAIGMDFKQWLDGCDKSPFTSWAEFRGHVVSVLAQMNGLRRQAAAAAKGDAPDTTSALFVGYIAGDAEMLLLDDKGGSSFERNEVRVWDGQPHSCTSAETAYRTLKAERGQAFVHDHALLGQIIEIVVASTMGVAPPVQLWKVTPDQPPECLQGLE